MDIAKRLKHARELESQTQVSRDTGINNKTLSGYERGVSEPDLRTFKLLANYYKVSVGYLLGNTSNPEIEQIETIAAHHDGEEYTEEELEEIENFKEFVRSRRKE